MSVRRPVSMYEHPHRGQQRDEPALEAAWRADADQGAHEQGEVGPARVSRRAFAEVGGAAQLGAAERAWARRLPSRPWRLRGVPTPIRVRMSRARLNPPA